MNPLDRPSALTGLDWDRCEATLSDFEEDWRAGRRPRLEDFVSRADPNSRRYVLRELVKLDIEYRWPLGERPRVEDYSAAFPELTASRDDWLELIDTELRVRRQQGMEPADSEIDRRFPDIAAGLRGMRLGSTQTSGTVPGDANANSAACDAPTIAQDLGRSLPAASLVGQFLGRYELREVLGRGGFATVYRAWDPELRREVAIKLPRAEFVSHEDLLGRVLREVQSAARLHHPSIVPIFEIGRHEQTTFIVYELISGPTLAEQLRSHPPAPEQAAQWVAELAEALHYAHQCGVVHRDVKPANVLMAASSSTGHVPIVPGTLETCPTLRPMLSDFGLALHTESAKTLTQEGDILGTPAYMPPEQAKGLGHRADPRSDVYSLGVVFYELLCGALPFEGSGASVLHRVIHDEPAAPRSRRAGVPIDLETICLKAMAKEPDRRFPSAGEMADDLHRYLRGEPILSRRIGVVGRFARWCRRNPALAATITVAIILLTVIGGASYRRVLEERNRYLAERQTAVANLYESLVREARAVRLARTTGYRRVAWDRIQEALRLETPARDPENLRREATACLGDFVGNEPAVWPRPADLSGWTSAVAVSPQDNLVAVAFTDAIQLRDADTGHVVAEFRDHKSGVFALSFSADGRTLVSMDDSGVIKVRRATRSGTRESSNRSLTTSATSWSVIRELQGIIGAERHQVVSVSCVLAPDGQRVLACSKGEQRVRMWNVETGKVEFDFRGLQNEPFVRAALSADGQTLVGAYRTAEIDGVVVWDVSRRQVVKTLPVSKQGIVDVAFSADGKFLACACVEGTYVFDTADWRQRTTVRSEDQFFTVAFHPTRPILAVPSSGTASVRLWDVVANREVATLKHPGAPHSLAFAPDGSFLVSASNDSLLLWNLRGSGEKRELSAHQGLVNHVKFSPDGRLLATTGTDAQVRLWDAATWKPLSQFSVSPTALGKVHRVAFSPDGQRLAAVDWAGAAAVFDIREPTMPARTQTLLHHEQPELGHVLWDVCFSPDGEHLAITGQNGVWLWRGEQRIAELTRQVATILLFTPDGRRVVWREQLRANVSVWNLETAREEPFTKPLAVLGTMTMFGDHQLLHFAGRNASDQSPILQLTDVRTGDSTTLDWSSIPRFVRELEIGMDLRVSADQSLLALNGANFTVWDLKSRRLQWVLPAEANPSNSFDWSPDRSQLAIGLTDGTVAVWNLPIVRQQLDSIGLGWE